MKKCILFVLLITCTVAFSPIQGQGRVKYTINDAWFFSKGSPHEAHLAKYDATNWEIVNIPHTWNDQDTDDEVPGYYRGPAWYRKNIFIDKSKQGSRIYLFFEGANQEVQVYINGHFAGSHVGGYTRFNFDITPYIEYDKPNVFAIKVDNTHNPNIPPLSADFNFWGGIYRDIYLMYTHEIHVATNHYGSDGVYIRTPKVSEKEALIDVEVLLTNHKKSKEEVRIVNTLFEPTGKEILSQDTKVKLNSLETKPNLIKGIKLNSPVLWDVENPYIYQLETVVYDAKTNQKLDEVISPLGIRFYSFDTEKGFFLNGRSLKLTGTNRHQDFYKKGNALRDEMHIRDIQLIKNMGGNFLRVSHYPQDPVVMEMCDKLGLLTSVEIPIVNAVTETEEFLSNSMQMLREMIYQDYNRPSVIIWGYMNETLLRRPYEEGTEQLTAYYKQLAYVAQELENEIKKIDPARETMIAYHNFPKAYEESTLTEIPTVQGWNLYQGWYEPDINEFQRLLDRARDTYKGKHLLVTEFGPGVDPRLHSFSPERFDFTQEYGIVYHSHYLKEMMKRPFVAGFTMWNLNDFYAEPRIDAVPHVNNKGVTGLDRERKDTYLFYQVSLNKNPMLWIGNREWKTRGGVVNTKNNCCIQKLPVFCNQPNVELIVNGQSLGNKKCKDNIVFFEVPFIQGVNHIEAIAKTSEGELRDKISPYFHLVGQNLRSEDLPFTHMNVMLGSHRYFEDREAEAIWIPEQEYKPGSWGYIGGEPYRRQTNFGSLLGTDIDVLGTDKNPIFQTQRVDIERFKADVPNGQYSIYFYWAELDDSQKEALAYNLGAEVINNLSEDDRIFSVKVNDEVIFDKVNLAEEYGIARSVIQKCIVNVTDGKGVDISFHPIQGKPILNAISIYKNY